MNYRRISSISLLSSIVRAIENKDAGVLVGGRRISDLRYDKDDVSLENFENYDKILAERVNEDGQHEYPKYNWL